MLLDTEQSWLGSFLKPRLFANIDGKDLLVKYVEGENTGQALLSRIHRHVDGATWPMSHRRLAME